MDGSNIQHFFEKLDRSLKRLGIVLVDDFEEVKKGVSAPIVALVRKLLFNTSTIVMKYMLLRGCPSHVGDKKVIISLFDLLRETVKYSPPISIDQFFVNGFGQHKVVILTKLAEYVAHIDRMAGRSGSKTAFVVHNEVLQSMQQQQQQQQQEETDDQGYSEPVVTTAAASAASIVSPSANTPKRPSSALRSPQVTTTNTTPSSSSSSSSSLVIGQRRSLSAQRAGMRSSSSASLTPTASNANTNTNTNTNTNSNSNYNANVGASGSPISAQFNSASVVEDKDTANNANATVSAVSPAVDLSQYVQRSEVQAVVDAMLQAKLAQTVSEISEKYDFVINKLVAAVDAEFTLLNNRIKSLETTLAHATGAAPDVSEGEAEQQEH